jgi:hypothetical protein
MRRTPVRYGLVSDPNGFTIELKEVNAKHINNNSNKIMLHVIDLEESIDFFVNNLGLKLYRKRSNVNSIPKHPSIIACLVS